jgi:hypothetical protein
MAKAAQFTDKNIPIFSGANGDAMVCSAQHGHFTLAVLAASVDYVLPGER